MSPILRLIASCLLLAGCTTSPPSAGRPGDTADAAPPADRVIGWARVTFDADGVTSAEAGGYADLEARRPMTVDDPLRVASISKMVTALGVMRLVEAGTLDLDADVSTYLGWTLRNPAFPDTPITLRQLLSHRSGIRDDAGYALPLDADLEDWLTQDGAWNAEHPPGEWFSYANLNFPIVAAVMEGATGERFDRIMARLVFEPLGIDACFNWTTCSDEAKARAVILYRPDGEAIRDTQDFIANGCPATPASDATCDLSTYVLARNGGAFSPQGGLRISARGLARIAPEIVRLTSQGLDIRSLSLLEGLTLAAPISGAGDTESGFYCVYYTAVQAVSLETEGCRADLFAGQWHLGHAGEAYGLRSGVWIDPESGTGVAYFATGLPEEGALPGRSAFTAIEERLAQGLPVETFVPERDWSEPEDAE